MTYDFFADKDDKIQILDFIFRETDLQICDLGSPYGQKVNQYKATEEVVSKFDLHKGINLQLHFNSGHQDLKAIWFSEKLNLIQSVVTDTPFDILLTGGD